MADATLTTLTQKLHHTPSYASASPFLSQAKLHLLKLQALTPSPTTSSALLSQAREIFELGALLSIRATLPDVFTKYVHLLRPFYELLDQKEDVGERNKIWGLYLLLLLTQGDYAGFHTELEGLEVRWGDGNMGTGSHGEQGGRKGGMMNGNGNGMGKEGKGLEDDRFLGYPIKLERWLMEGAYDLVWKAMASGKVPSEEYGVFSEILTTQIRSEIASCSETAYPSLPISSTKNLLFLDSEGAVISFANHRGWTVKDGRIYFPNQLGGGKMLEEEGEEQKEMSQVAIENTLGYARELETIV